MNANACVCLLRCVVFHCGSMRGSSDATYCVLHTGSTVGDAGAISPPLVSMYGEAVAFAAKQPTCRCSGTEAMGTGRSSSRQE